MKQIGWLDVTLGSIVVWLAVAPYLDIVGVDLVGWEGIEAAEVWSACKHASIAQDSATAAHNLPADDAATRPVSGVETKTQHLKLCL